MAVLAKDKEAGPTEELIPPKVEGVNVSAITDKGFDLNEEISVTSPPNVKGFFFAGVVSGSVVGIQKSIKYKTL